jgi:ABC-type sugar transport system substrate-binding protein
MRDDDRAGLSWFAIEAADAKTREDALARLKGAGVPVTGSEGSQVRDPFGTRVRFA